MRTAVRRMRVVEAFRALLVVSSLVLAGWARPAPAHAQAEDTLRVRELLDGAATASPRARATLDRVGGLLAAGRPVSAASLLARELASGALEGDAAVVLAARAYAEGRSWASVRRLLASRDFSSPAADREAALLLGRAYAGLDSAGPAVAAYRRFLELAAETFGPDAPVELGVRVDLARVLGKAGRWGEAARELEAAEAEHPDLAHWIRLSRLQALVGAEDPAAFALVEETMRRPPVPADSALLPVARLAFELDRPDLGLALARRASEGARRELAGPLAPHLLALGDTAGAADLFRVELSRRDVPEETGSILLALDRSWRSLREVGLSDARAGRTERAARFLEVALDLAPADEKPGIAERLAGVESSRGRPERALAILEPWLAEDRGGRAAHADLWLAASRALDALGRAAEAHRAYERAAEGTGGSAAMVAYLIADEHHDAGRRTEAAEAFERAYRRFPGSSYGSRSLERAAMLAYDEGRFGEALSLLEAYRERYGRGAWTQGAIYWSAKAKEALGDSAAAEALYLRALTYDPLDYYAILAAEKLGRARWAEVDLRPPAELPALDPVHGEALGRMNRLRQVGWVGRARLEYREARARGPDDFGSILAFARALNDFGWTQEGVAEGWRAKALHPGWSRPILEAIYPLPFREALVAAARARGLPPHLVAGLSRRESMFDPQIVSAANAVGLMQLLPETARDVAERAGLPDYDRGQLTVPEVNLLLGTRYLADVLERFGGSRAAGMISYNAGPHRYVRWRDFPEFGDHEMLVERIPFRETREYVRAVTELTEIYRFLYPELEGPTP